MKLILHPGHAKCGSTTIQRFLRINRELLFENDILVPDLNFRFPGERGFVASSESPRKFFREIMESVDLSKLVERLKFLKSNYPNKSLLVSAENLTVALAAIGKEIHSLFSDFFEDVHIIYYIRPQDTYMLSSWQQWGYKSGVTLNELCVQNNIPDYAGVIRSLKIIYNKPWIDVVPLNKNALLGGGLISDFLKRVSFPKLDYTYSNDLANVSLSPVLCDFLSNQKFLFKDHHENYVEDYILKRLNDKPIFFERVDGYFNKEERLKILNSRSESNRFLHKHFFSELSFQDVFYGHLECFDNLKLDEYERKRQEISETLNIRRIYVYSFFNRFFSFFR
jgi:hypothetical protein